ncbi:MAG: transketolase C-terminal domain-containing protein, partial [Bacillota bacterium]
ARETKLLVTIEDHSVVGGLGGAVAEVLSEEPLVRHRRLGLQDTFSILGSPDELLAYHGVSPEGIASSVTGWL